MDISLEDSGIWSNESKGKQQLKELRKPEEPEDGKQLQEPEVNEELGTV